MSGEQVGCRLPRECIFSVGAAGLVGGSRPGCRSRYRRRPSKGDEPTRTDSTLTAEEENQPGMAIADGRKTRVLSVIFTTSAAGRRAGAMTSDRLTVAGRCRRPRGTYWQTGNTLTSPVRAMRGRRRRRSDGAGGCGCGLRRSRGHGRSRRRLATRRHWQAVSRYSPTSGDVRHGERLTGAESGSCRVRSKAKRTRDWSAPRLCHRRRPPVSVVKAFTTCHRPRLLIGLIKYSRAPVRRSVSACARCSMMMHERRSSRPSLLRRHQVEAQPRAPNCAYSAPSTDVAEPPHRVPTDGRPRTSDAG